MENTYKNKEGEFIEVVKDIWKDPVGKVILILGGSLTLVVLVGCAFKVTSFTMNQYKDFRDAYRR